MSHGQSMPQPDSPHHRRFGHGFPPLPLLGPCFVGSFFRRESDRGINAFTIPALTQGL